MLDDAAFGAATEVTPKFISPADPAARWTGAHGGQAFFAYSTNYLIDTDNAIIVDVEATTAIRQAEVLAAKRMIERTMESLALHPRRLLGDSAYGSAEMLGWLVSRARHRAACDRVRQVGAQGRHLLARGLQVRSGRRRLPLSRRQDADHDGHARERRRDAALSRRARPTVDGLRLEAALLSERRRPAKCRARSTRALATWRVRSPSPGKAACLDGCARRSRCCSPTSNASSSSTGFDYEGPPAPATSSSSQQPPRTSESSQS